MKHIFKASGITFLIILFTSYKNIASAQPVAEVSYQVFYDELSPYGRWVDYPDYGYVWCPDEGPDFRPYSTSGRWVWNDDYDWMWVSDYSWGWAPFHYGRWFYDRLYGWMWVPGYDWAPAWVTWRSGGDYYGWAPIMPGININIGFSWGSYTCPADYWCFAPRRYITYNRIYDYCVSPRQNVTIINNTTIINNNVSYRKNVFINGPQRRDVEGYTNERITSVRVRNARTSGSTGFNNNEVAVYRPTVQRNNYSRSMTPGRVNSYRGNNSFAQSSYNSVQRKSLSNERFERYNHSNSGIGNRISQGTQSSTTFNRSNTARESIRRGDNQSAISRRNNNENIYRPNTSLGRSEENVAARPPENVNTERNAFTPNNRRGFNRPVERKQFEKQDMPLRNENSNRNFHSAPVNRGFNQPQQQQQRQSFPQVERRQEQPRVLETAKPDNGNQGGSRRGFLSRKQE